MSTFDPKDWRPFNPWLIVIVLFLGMLMYMLNNPLVRHR